MLEVYLEFRYDIHVWSYMEERERICLFPKGYTGGKILNYDTELLVIGGGASGMAAACAALEKGIKVIVAEALPKIGGNGLFPRGVFAVNSVLQRKKLIFCDTDQIFKDCMEDAHWKIDGRIIRTLLEKSGDTISWLENKGVEFVDVVHHIPNQNPEVFHICDERENAGLAVMKALEKYCRKKGGQIMTSTKAKQLLVDEEGAVYGAVLTTEDGRDLEIKAQRVIIGTGGFAGNEEMIARYYPDFKSDEVARGGGIRHTGEGLQMALDAGADIDGHFTMEIAGPKIVGYPELNLLIGKPYNVWLNSFGKRFADEGIVYHFAESANAIMRQPESQVWVLFDQGMIDQTLRDGRDMIELIHIPEGAEERLPHTIEDAIEGGILKRCDRPQSLASFIGCDPQQLMWSLEEYNSYCESGRDGVFAKDRKYLRALSHGPYYALKAGVDMLITHGGVRVDESFHALNKQQLPVKNLFVAGVDFGGADADVYNVNMSGHGFGFALNSGRIAGETAAQEIKLKN